jgi:hypothetical protein
MVSILGLSASSDLLVICHWLLKESLPKESLPKESLPKESLPNNEQRTTNNEQRTTTNHQPPTTYLALSFDLAQLPRSLS